MLSAKAEWAESPALPAHLLEQGVFRALDAWIGLHISDQNLNLTQDDWERYWLESAENPAFEARGALAQFQSKMLRESARKSRAPSARSSRMQRSLARIGASPAACAQMQSGGGEATVEAVCGWTEVKRAYGKTYDVFHPGAAGLTALESRVLELSQRFLDEWGRPDFVRISAYCGAASRGATLQTLRRARMKVQAYWHRMEAE